MLKISVLVDNDPRIYKRLGNKALRSFIIAYFDLSYLLTKEKVSIDEVITTIILSSGRFIGEEIPEEKAVEIISYLENNCEQKRIVDPYTIYIVSEGSVFLELFEETLREELQREYHELINTLSHRKDQLS